MENQDQRGGFVTVHVPPAYLYGGLVHVGGDEIQLALKRDNAFDKSYPYSLEVAAGLDKQYYFVTVITIIVSSLGALMMLRDLSEVVVWV